MVASKFILLVFAVVAAAASVAAQTPVQDIGPSEVRVTMHAPTSATPVSAQAAVDMTQSQLVAARLRKIWPAGSAAVLDDNSDRSPDGNELLGQFNAKYGVNDRFRTSQHLKDEEDLPPMDLPVAPEDIPDSELPQVAEDYKTIYRGANRGDFDANVDNPETLNAMLGALWGKRWHHVTQEEQDAKARNTNTVVMRASPASNERISMRMSSDGSVDKFVAIADDSADVEASIVEAKKFPLPSNGEEEFKPKTTWVGPRVSGSALDVTGANLSATERVPNDPPKPPVPSYVIPDHHTMKLADNEAPVTVIQTIRVTPETRPNGLKPTENVFTPIMAEPKGLSKRAFIVG